MPCHRVCGDQKQNKKKSLHFICFQLLAVSSNYKKIHTGGSLWLVGVQRSTRALGTSLVSLTETGWSMGATGRATFR
jgi:hypothetical protein